MLCRSVSELNADAEDRYRLQDYTPRPRIDGIEIVDLRRFNDDGGAMTELCRLEDGRLAGMDGFVVRQVNYSTMDPLAIKAFHLHRRQTDVWYVPPSDKILLCIGDVRRGSSTENEVQRIVLGDGNSRLARIPPGVAHGAKNLMRDRVATIVYFVDVQFSTGEECDEGRLAWDHFGEGIWEVERG